MWIRWSFLVLSNVRSRRHWRFPSQIGLFPAQHWNRTVISICHEWSQLPLTVCTRRDPAVTETLLCRRSGLGSAVLHSTQQANCQQQTIWGYIGDLFTYNLCWSKDTTSDTYCHCSINWEWICSFFVVNVCIWRLTLKKCNVTHEKYWSKKWNN